MIKNKTRRGFTRNCLPKGFTLIELLVVVLIIGILAAIAVPQYQKAVDRARAVEAVQLIATLKKATETWMLANPGVASARGFNILKQNAATQLDVDLPCKYDKSLYCEVNNLMVVVDIYPLTADVYIVQRYGNTSAETVIIAAQRDSNGIWTHTCGYVDNRGKAICSGLQGYTAEKDFDI